jgi:hypothetical protein
MPPQAHWSEPTLSWAALPFRIRNLTAATINATFLLSQESWDRRWSHRAPPPCPSHPLAPFEPEPARRVEEFVAGGAWTRVTAGARRRARLASGAPNAVPSSISGRTTTRGLAAGAHLLQLLAAGEIEEPPAGASGVRVPARLRGARFSTSEGRRRPRRGRAGVGIEESMPHAASESRVLRTGAAFARARGLAVPVAPTSSQIPRRRSGDLYGFLHIAHLQAEIKARQLVDLNDDALGAGGAETLDPPSPAALTPGARFSEANLFSTSTSGSRTQRRSGLPIQAPVIMCRK